MCAIQINYEPLMSERTSLKLGGRAIAELLLNNEEDVFLLSDSIKKLGGEVKVLGRGTNILCKDSKQILPFVLLKTNFQAKPIVLTEQLNKNNQNFVLVKASSSCNLPILLNFFAKNKLSGLEGLAGIPGNVGGAVAMNAGSYGDEIGHCLNTVTIFSLERGLEVLDASDFESSYRTFKVKNLNDNQWFIILNAVFTMHFSNEVSILKKMKECIVKKHQTQPITAHSAGCLFKNPSLYSAGKLLDEAGFKGKELGDMAFSNLHANFLINKGEGTSDQAFELIFKAKEAVIKKYNIELEIEVKILP